MFDSYIVIDADAEGRGGQEPERERNERVGGPMTLGRARRQAQVEHDQTSTTAAKITQSQIVTPFAWFGIRARSRGLVTLGG